MAKEIIIKTIKRENVFQPEFENLQNNNILKFKNVGKNNIAVIYGANGTGKTSFIRALSQQQNCTYRIIYSGNEYLHSNEALFHVINDQNARNIIEDTPDTYLLGDDIKNEIALKDEIDSLFDELFSATLNNLLKTEFAITKATANLLNFINDDKLKTYCKSIANRQKRGKDINHDDFVHKIKSQTKISIHDYEKEKFNYVLSKLEDKSSFINELIKLEIKSVSTTEKILVYNKTNSAIEILTKYHDMKDCIVCDTPGINPEKLLQEKQENRDKIIGSLGDFEKKILNDIIEKIDDPDVLNLKNRMQKFLQTGEENILRDIHTEINTYVEIFNSEMNNSFIESFKQTKLVEKIEEFDQVLADPPVISDDDLLFIQDIVSGNLDKDIVLERTGNDNKFRLLLDNEEFFGIERDSLKLSNGEQNFISLAFELLKAKNSDKEFIAIDDPISSFDSIYKNKIAYCLIKFIEGKNQLILTHNIELMKLLNFQLKNCFNLYVMNNVEDGNNGFIEIKYYEKKILFSSIELITLLRTTIKSDVINEKLFLLSLIPFMRGYANFIGNSHKYKLLSKLMHSYEKSRINITKIFNVLFDRDYLFQEKYIVSANELLNVDLDDEDILNNEKYPMLNRILYHTLNYMVIRLRVEDTLVRKYGITIDGNMTLQNIISKAFPLPNPDPIKELEIKKLRNFFMSKKTLLNEFNHFESNINIYQPAIDITEVMINTGVNPGFLNNLQLVVLYCFC